MKRFIVFFLSISLILGLLLFPSSAYYTISIDGVDYTYNNISELNKEICLWEKRNAAAKSMRDSAYILGYSSEDQVLQTAEFEIQRTSDKLNILNSAKSSILKNHQSEYPVANFVWNHLKSKGYNDYVAAGIMGNMMIEVGGGTLQLDYDAYGQGYYGLCQWGKHYPDVWGQSLQYQCDFLDDTIKYELNTFGNLYYKGFNYKKFTQLQDERAAALAFAKCYERCAAGGYGRRQNCAEIAYNYFT